MILFYLFEGRGVPCHTVQTFLKLIILMTHPPDAGITYEQSDLVYVDKFKCD